MSLVPNFHAVRGHKQSIPELELRTKRSRVAYLLQHDREGNGVVATGQRPNKGVNKGVNHGSN